MIDILHVPYTYFPDRTGGTETYVAALVHGLRSRGLASAVAAPVDAGAPGTYTHEATTVHRFGTSTRVLPLEDQYGEGDAVAAGEFARVLARERPRIVHLHAWTSGISLRTVRAARAAGSRVVFTYHTPGVSCARGSLMIYGRTVCDGALFVNRCARCVLQQHGVPLAAGALLGEMPTALGRIVRGRHGNLWTALRMTELMEARHDAFRSLVRESHAMVAVQDWVFDLLVYLGVSREKLTLSRLALPTLGPVEPTALTARERRQGAPVRMAYFGRLDETKGVHVVVEALRTLPSLPIELDVYGAPQGEEGEAYLSRLRATAAGDGRIRFLGPLAGRDVPTTMNAYDVVVVPSVWMETGPLVVPEAMSVGVPVIGSALGGIPTFIRDGVDGLLVAPGDAAAWATVFRRLVHEPQLLTMLAAGVRPPETMSRVVDEMVRLYAQVGQM